MAELKQIVRIANADIIGTKPIESALRKVQGIGYSFANAVCVIMNFDRSKKIGSLTTEELAKVNDIIRNPSKYNIPSWLYNRKRDASTGEDLHLIAADLKLKNEFDIKRLKNIKSYRGMRHSAGLPVRGQRTRGHFRKGTTVGVVKKGIKMAKADGEKKTGKHEKAEKPAKGK